MSIVLLTSLSCAFPYDDTIVFTNDQIVIFFGFNFVYVLFGRFLRLIFTNRIFFFKYLNYLGLFLCLGDGHTQILA